MTQKQIERAGYRLDYQYHNGSVVRVSIRRPSGEIVCTHFHTQGVVDAFNRILPGQSGRMTQAEEREAKQNNALRLNDIALLQNIGR